jgi:hypothetical protein
MKVFRLVSESFEVQNGTATVGRVHWLGEREGRIDELQDARGDHDPSRREPQDASQQLRLP